uniref:Guanylate cyclase n=1 Tax=Hirondellea gigas TaxID=1518452 RepID=A0A6A7G3V0_9CRUS
MRTIMKKTGISSIILACSLLLSVIGQDVEIAELIPWTFNVSSSSSTTERGHHDHGLTISTRHRSTATVISTRVVATDTCFRKAKCSGTGGRRSKIPGHSLKLVFLATCSTFTRNLYLGIKIPGAVAVAVDKVNNDHLLPQNYTLHYEVHDTSSKLLRSVGLVCQEAHIDEVGLIIGPDHAQCNVEAIVAASNNKPLFSYACDEDKAAHNRNFLRINPTQRTVRKKTINLLVERKWKKFLILFTPTQNTKAEQLHRDAKTEGLDPLDIRGPVNDMTQIVAAFQETKSSTRIYVILSHNLMLSRFLVAMSVAGLLQFDPPRYMLIFLENQGQGDYRNQWRSYIRGNLWSTSAFNHEMQRELLQQFSGSLLVVRGRYPSKEDYGDFMTQVANRNKLPPFCVPIGRKNRAKQMPYLATAYLYDAIILYAKSVRELYEKTSAQNSSVTVRDIARNGTGIVDHLRNSNYSSILGYNTSLHENEGSQDIYGIYAFYYCHECSHIRRSISNNSEGSVNNTLPSPSSSSRVRRASDRGPAHNRKGISCIDNSSNDAQNDATSGDQTIVACLIDIEKNHARQLRELIYTIVDEPECGFDGEKCNDNDSKMRTIMLAFIIFGLPLPVIVMLQYKIWNAERMIMGLQWRISKNEIECISSRTRGSTRSLVQTNSNGGYFYSRVGIYQGSVVCLKQCSFGEGKIKFSRKLKKDICEIRDLKHRNLCAFLGICMQDDTALLVTEYRDRGSLHDVLNSEYTCLDEAFISSLIQDLLKGMSYLHENYGAHGRLTATNCVVTSRWTLQITDYGLNKFRYADAAAAEDCFKVLYNSLYRAPELLREPPSAPGTKEGDVYSLGIILHETVAGSGPFSLYHSQPDAQHIQDIEEVLRRVKRGSTTGEPLMRPNITELIEKPLGSNKKFLNLLRECWAEDVTHRPTFKAIVTFFPKLTEQQRSGNLMDHLVSMMEKYSSKLEKTIESRTFELQKEKILTEELLYSMLPRPVAQSLKHGIGVEPQSYDKVTIYFSDIVGFTSLSSDSTPMQIVTFLDDLYRMFDQIIKGYDVYKVETIGDAYMVVSGLPEKNELRHAGEIASMSLELIDKTQNEFKIAHRPQQLLELRVGLHTGPVMAGVVGLSMPRYCLFGDTVNTAARMESNGAANRIHISSACRTALEDLGGYVMETRGVVEMKGKGQQITHWLNNATHKAIKRRKTIRESMAPLLQKPGEYQRMSQSSFRLSYTDDSEPAVPRRCDPPMSLSERQRFMLDRERCASISSLKSEVMVLTRSGGQRGLTALCSAGSLDKLPPSLLRRNLNNRNGAGGVGTAMMEKRMSQSLTRRPTPPHHRSSALRLSHPPSPLVESDL